MIKNLERYSLVKKDLFIFRFPFEASKFNNEKLSSFIINKYINYEFTIHNKYSDVLLSDEHDNNMVWLQTYVSERYNALEKLTLVPINTFAQINGFLDSSYKRNHVDPFNYKLSPHFTSIYVVKGTGKLIIEFPDYKQEDAYKILDLEPGTIYLFNSDLNYFTDKNRDKNINRQLMITNYERI